MAGDEAANKAIIQEISFMVSFWEVMIQYKQLVFFFALSPCVATETERGFLYVKTG